MTYVCVTCGTQYTPADRPPERCPICEDERQFVGLQGQQWITLEKLELTHRNTFFQEGEGVWGIQTVPDFGIGQRALLVRAGNGNILWDCISLVSSDTVALVNALGGISAIAISHPHYYTSMIEWSRAFGGVPIYLHEDDRQWVQRPDACITFWRGETHDLEHGLTLIRVGGHFPGFQVVHSAEAEHGQGALFTGDQPQVCPDRRYVSFMYSYPNFIPLDAASVRRIVFALEPFSFVTLYGAWRNFVVQGSAKEALRRSAERYLRAFEARPNRALRGHQW
jgi:glyoxylase-like metal-dependent hydrolase (beta-lactamase superfamily II)